MSERFDGPGSAGLDRRSLLRAGGLAAVGGLAGCLSIPPRARPETADGPTEASLRLPDRPATLFRSDIARTGYWPTGSVPEAVELDWSVPGINTGDHTAAKSSPLYYDGRVIVPGDTGVVKSFTPAGERTWSASLSPSTRGTHSTPAIVEEFVFTAGYDGAVYAFDARDGGRRWRTGVADAIGSSPVYYDGLVYVATEFYTPSGGMVALDAATGALVWEDTRMTDHAHSIPGVDTETGTLAAGCNDGRLYVWNLEDRSFRGTFETGDAIKGPICLANGTALFGSWDDTVYAVDVETLEAVWEYDVGASVMAGVAVHQPTGTAVFGSHDGHLYGLDAATGDFRWTFDTGGWVIGSPTVVGETVLSGSYADSLYALGVETGELRWQAPEPRGWVTATPAVHDDAIYVTERATERASGRLYRFVGV